MTDPFAESSRLRFNPVPSLLTLGNACCGLASIIYAVASYARGEAIPEICLWLLLGAMVFDTLDGLAARLLNASSLHGANLDSLADAISFGVAPAVTIFVFIQRHASGGLWLAVWMGWVVALFYLGCTLWRLARYNALMVMGKKDHGCFLGLPSPAAASMIYSAGFILPRLALQPHLLFYVSTGYAVLTGLLMVSRIPYPHVRRCVSGEPRVLSILFVCAVLGSVALFRLTALVIWAYIYFLIAPLAELLVRKKAGRSVQTFLFSSFSRKRSSRAD